MSREAEADTVSRRTGPLSARNPVKASVWS